MGTHSNHAHTHVKHRPQKLSGLRVGLGLGGQDLVGTLEGRMEHGGIQGSRFLRP